MDRIQQLKKTIFSMVREFRTVSGLPMQQQKRLPKKVEEMVTEHILLHEEWVELWNAVQAGDLVEVADAYMDIVYFAAGAVLRFGLHGEIPTLHIDRRQVPLLDHMCLLGEINELKVENYNNIITLCVYAFENKFPQASFLKCFEEVHRSNMTKFCKDKTEAIQTHMQYMKDDVFTKYTQIGKWWIITRQSDGKVLKSMNWQTPNLHKYLND